MDKVTKYYCYCDETVFDGAMGETFGSGFLVTDQEVSQNVIDIALQRLSENIRKSPLDDKTLKRGYFHASQDSSNAHSCICTAINENIEGEFLYEYTRDEPSLIFAYHKAPNNEALIRATFQNNFLKISQRARDIEFIVEKRIGLSAERLCSAIGFLFSQLESSAALNPSIPIIFPKCKVRINDKQDQIPGLQAVDFILWATNRTKRKEPNQNWFSRLRNASFQVEATIKGTPESGGNIRFKRSILVPISNYPKEVLPVQPPQDDLEAFDALCLMERWLRILVTQDLPPHVDHITGTLENVVGDLYESGPTINHELLQRASRIYVRLFDTLPIASRTNVTDNQSWRRLLLGRMLASKFLGTDASRFNDMNMYIGLRAINFLSHPEYFGV